MRVESNNEVDSLSPTGSSLRSRHISRASNDIESNLSGSEEDEETELLHSNDDDPIRKKKWLERWFPAIANPSLLARRENYIGGTLLLVGYAMLAPGMFLAAFRMVTSRSNIRFSMWNSVVLAYEIGWTGTVSGQYAPISLRNAETGEWDEVIPTPGFDPIRDRQDSGLGPAYPTSVAACYLNFIFCVFLPYFKGLLVILGLLMQSERLMFWTLKISKVQHSDVLEIMQLSRFLRAKGISEVIVSYPLYLFLGYCLFASLGTQILDCQFYNPKLACKTSSKSVVGIWLPLGLLHLIAMGILLGAPYLTVRAGGAMAEGNAVFYERAKSFGQILGESPFGASLYVVCTTIIVPTVMYVVMPIMIRFHGSYCSYSYFIFPSWPMPTRKQLFRVMSLLWDWALGDVLLLSYLILWLGISRGVDTWPLINGTGGFAMCLYGVCNASIWFCYMLNCSVFGQPNQDYYVETAEDADGNQAGNAVGVESVIRGGNTFRNWHVLGKRESVAESQRVSKDEPEPEGEESEARTDGPGDPDDSSIHRRKKIEPEAAAAGEGRNTSGHSASASRSQSVGRTTNEPGSTRSSTAKIGHPERGQNIADPINVRTRRRFHRNSPNNPDSESAEAMVLSGRAKGKTLGIYICQWFLFPALLLGAAGMIWMCCHMSERPSAVDLIPTDPMKGFATGVTASLHDKGLLDRCVNAVIARQLGSVGECALKGHEVGPPANVTCVSVVNGVPQGEPSKEPLFTISSTSHAQLFDRIPMMLKPAISEVIVHHVTGFEKIKITQFQAHVNAAQPQYSTWPDGPLIKQANFTLVADISHDPKDDARGKPNLPVKAEVTPWTGTMLNDFCCNMHRVSVSIISDCKPNYPFFENLRVDEKLRIEPAILHDGSTLASLIKGYAEGVLESSLRDQLNKVVVKSANQMTFYNPLEEREMTFEDMLNAVFQYNLPRSTKNFLAQCNVPEGRGAADYHEIPPGAVPDSKTQAEAEAARPKTKDSNTDPASKKDAGPNPTEGASATPRKPAETEKATARAGRAGLRPTHQTSDNTVSSRAAEETARIRPLRIAGNVAVEP